MNILALNWNDLKNPYGGGAEVHLEELLRRLATYGHQVTLFCSGYPGCAPEEAVEGIRIIRRGSRQTFNLVAPFHLPRLVRENSFDILVEDINKIPFYTPLYLKMKTLVVIPHLFATSVFQEINFVIGTYIYLAERPLVRVYRGKPFNVISESTREDIIKRGVPPEDVSVIHCGIDRNLYAYDAKISKYARPTILYLGRVKKYKSIQHLILAFKQVREQIPEAHLMVVGAGDYLPELVRMARKLNLENEVEFTGFVSTEQKVERMRRAHVAVMPSLKEGWGLTNIEANSVGTCVVAADVAGLRDSVRDGETGLLYPYGDIEALSDRIARILRDSAYRRKLEAGALTWAESFNWDSAARKFESLLFEVLEKY